MTKQVEQPDLLGGHFFDQLKTDGGKTVVGTVYHWSANSQPELKLAAIDERTLSVCDDYWSWFDANCRVYRLTVAFQKPLVLHEQFEVCEHSFAEGRALHWELVKSGQFDSIVYTPHEYGQGQRQALLLQPKKQVLSIEAFHDYDEALLLENREGLAANWNRLLNHTPGPYTVTQLRELEQRLMAYRYAYYVQCDPIITDAEYDRLDKAVMPWLPKDSPLQRPGSDMESSYKPEHITYAGFLRFGRWIDSARAE